MCKRISLRSRIILVLGALVVITVGGGLVSILHTFIMDQLFTEVMESDVLALQAAQELENALIMQKGYATYYYQDGDPVWLKQLDESLTLFDAWLKRVRQWAATEKEREILNQIESQYIRFGHSRDQVLNLYKEGNKEPGFELHKSVRKQLFSVIELCRDLKKAYQERISAARKLFAERARLINVIACVALVTVVMLSVVLAYILFNQVLGPIRELAMESDGRRIDVANEVTALSRRFQHLIEDVDQTRSKLIWSREHLQQAEKWALVGKLAAGVAHSVRNPLTSVKMRLFSLGRALALTPSQKEDFEVISEEIRHIDIIVGNFLEFSRPPKLKMQRMSPSDAVDNAVQLLKHRLESYDVKVEIHRNVRLPEIAADSDQLKEVLVNLVVNACEAMVDGGFINIYETVGTSDTEGEIIIIKVSDTGPGVPGPIKEKLFQPFFSSKEEGTGLGLSIAVRIVEEHGGWLDVESEEGKGATFIITLPAQGG
jgi:signal transduction histidine kinase